MNGDNGEATAEFDKLSPLYEQVKQRILADVDSGRLAEGDFLPPEPELCTTLGVSRITLRRAVTELCDIGLLMRQQGRGTVVAPRKARQTLVSLSGFADAMEDLGKVKHRVLEREDSATNARAGAALGLGPKVPLTRFLRLITVDERPMTLETLCFQAGRFPDLLAPVAGGDSFFQGLRDAYGLEPASAERIIDVGFATPDERRHLDIGPSQPVYRMEKTVFGPDRVPISWSGLITPTHLVTYSIWTGPSGSQG